MTTTTEQNVAPSPAPPKAVTTEGETARRIAEIRQRLSKIPPHFCTRGAKDGYGNRGAEECHNTIMDNNGRIIADSLNADLRCVEDDGDGRYSDSGTTAYFDVFANAPEDLRFLLAALASPAPVALNNAYRAVAEAAIRYRNREITAHDLDAAIDGLNEAKGTNHA